MCQKFKVKNGPDGFSGEKIIFKENQRKPFSKWERK